MFLTKTFLIVATTGSLSNNIGISLSQNTTQITNINEIKSDSKIIDFNATMLEAFKASFMFNHPTEYQTIENISDFKINNLLNSNIEIKKVGNQILDFNDNKFNFMGENTFANNNDFEQTYQTTAFERSLSSEVGASTVLGISLGITQQIDVFKTNTTIDFGSTSSQKTTVTTSITVPSQSVRVAPHKQVKVHIFWGQTKFIQNLILKSDISGNLTEFINFKDKTLNQNFEVSIASAVYYLQLANKCPEGISLNENTNIVNFNGVAQAWQSNIGSNQTVIIDQETDIPPNLKGIK
ncbi:ETX/MTX2 family pore-forming toxin [Spiroplasma sp. AdecLV25b]|uniref:ETX/MTX2 family pore-forming toxin n=1 Tax=Spiroplasma sp. AdecLV25b TaxID=3027162 RepID=UPI0027DF2274|nr:ETX/MTX2 family pore-forming toxin [Spiroplasma sp. AdecLV25b]